MIKIRSDSAWAAVSFGATDTFIDTAGDAIPTAKFGGIKTYHRCWDTSDHSLEDLASWMIHRCREPVIQELGRRLLEG